jgi:hypothetical protein
VSEQSGKFGFWRILDLDFGIRVAQPIPSWLEFWEGISEAG